MVSAAMSRPVARSTPSIGWARIVGIGLMAGVATATIESLDLPIHGMDVPALLAFELQLVTDWSGPFILLTTAIAILSQRVKRVTLPMMLALLTAFAALSTLDMGLGFHVVRKAVGPPKVHLQAAWSHIALMAIVYGGLYLGAYQFATGSERARQLFAQAEIARQRTEALLGVERVRALQGHLDPTLLLSVMVEVQRRYVEDGAGSSRLVGALVTFLRCVMPALRNGMSTLATELQLARDYATLRAELDPTHATWAVQLDAAPPELPFPALWLLPVLDRLVAGSAKAGAAACVAAHVTSGHCTLRLLRESTGSGPWLEADALHRLQVALRATFGDAYVLTARDRPHNEALTLELTRQTAVHMEPAADSSTRHEEAHS